MRKFILASLLLLPVIAHAHPGHAGQEHSLGFLAGALHPFTGMDHMLGILAAGWLMGFLPGRLRWPVCAGFLAVLGATHAVWMAPGATGAGYAPGLVLASALLLAASTAASRLITRRLTAAAAR